MMRTIVITGGTDGIGKQLALHYMREGYSIIAIGRSAVKGEHLRQEAVRLCCEERFLFIQAELSLVSENNRVVKEVSERVQQIDLLFLCAQSQKFSKTYRETQEGLEFHFALYYLSRFILSFGFRSLLENSANPLIVNVCAPGVKGVIQWHDLQLQELSSFNSIKAIMHGSRLNNLLGTAFSGSEPGCGVKYVLFNPGAVRTNGATEAFENKALRLFVKLMYRIIGQPAEKAIGPIVRIAAAPPAAPLTAFKQAKPLDIDRIAVNPEHSGKLLRMTQALLKPLLPGPVAE